MDALFFDVGLHSEVETMTLSRLWYWFERASERAKKKGSGGS